jgi:cation:H+ antiporter
MRRGAALTTRRVQESGRMKGALAAAVVAAKASPLTALWTFPSVLFSAFLVAWGAEAAQFLVSQGLALAILAWLQTLPEFAVEAVIAWQAGKDPARVHLAIANFTGSIRLLVGLGWPLVYFVAAFFARRTGKRGTWVHIEFDDEHSIEVMGLLPPLAWFAVIWWKGSLGLWDAAILTLCYVAYLVALMRIPPREGDVEELEDLPAVSRWALSFGPGRRAWAIAGIFVVGGAILVVSAHAFVESMLALALAAGIPAFVFVQWVAPFLSEFPEKLSAFNWARQISKAPMAVMNLVSSTINQWSILSALIPVVYSISRGQPSAIAFDEHQRMEILLTILQSFLGWLLLVNLDLRMFEALILFVFWLVQFLVPSLRGPMIGVYAGWCGLEILFIVLGRRRLKAIPAALRVLRMSRGRRKTA